MNKFIQMSILLGFYASQKPNQSPEEQGFTKAFAAMLQSEALAPYLEQLHADGVVDNEGNLTKYGAIIVKKMNNAQRNPKQLNFKRLTENSTPGYNAALGLTALNRFFEQHKEGVFTRVNGELYDSLTDLCDQLNNFGQTIEIEEQTEAEA